MARSVINDLLQNHRFWLFDAIPSATLPFFVLGSPVYAFSSITMPEYTFDTRKIKQANSMFKRSVYEGGELGEITLSRGCRIYDDSFYAWVKSTIDGTDTIERTLMLVQYTGAGSAIEKNQTISNVFKTFEAVQNPWRAFAQNVDMDKGYALNVPGRAWLLYGCIPTRYKAASDFDATDGGISIMELDIQPFAFVEFALASPIL